MDSHQKVWNAIDTIAKSAGSSPSGLAKAAGMDGTAFNPSKRVDTHGRPHWRVLKQYRRSSMRPARHGLSSTRLAREQALRLSASDCDSLHML